MSNANAGRIDLGIRLNHLLDQRTHLGQPGGAPGGLILPAPKNMEVDDALGTGIVVIAGDPGSGKSTLGLQIAVAAAEQDYDTAYISLEEEPERVEKKAMIFGWNERLWHSKDPLDFIASEKLPSDPRLSNSQWLLKLLENCHEECRKKSKLALGGGRILLPGLLPRPLEPNEARLTDFFWSQYRQIEFLVRAASKLNEENYDELKKTGKVRRGIRLVVIDSLNMLGVESHNREMLHRLFDLFRQNRIMGVFTVEANDTLGFDSTMGDVVFNFSHTTDSGYAITLLECSKSRFYSRTKGSHPYKFKSLDDVSPLRPKKKAPVDDRAAASSPQLDEGSPRAKSNRHSPKKGEVGVVVYPSPHAVVAATKPIEGPSHETDDAALTGKFPFGWGDKITDHLLRGSLHRGNVVTLAGRSGTLKSQVALNFLLHGLIDKEAVLYVRLRTPERLDFLEEMRTYAFRDRETAEEVAGADIKKLDDVKQLRDHLEKVSWDNALSPITSRTKVQISVYSEQGKRDMPRLILADFHTGVLLAEEFIDTIRLIFEEAGPKISRVVLDDVGSIGVSYPLLKHSITTGNLFLSAFVHVMKNKKVSLLMIGTTGDLPAANEMVHQACSLADGVLRTSVETVFGDKYVLLTGDGMAAGRQDRSENPPVVLLPGPSELELTPDPQLLDEFVGFESHQITRPGVVLHLYSEGEIYDDYNLGLVERLQERFGRPGVAGTAGLSGVQLASFEPGGIVQLKPSERNGQQERPRDHTSVRIIDEFEPREKEDEPYCFTRNVLLMAYRTDVEGHERIEQCDTWSKLRDVVAELDLPRPPKHLEGLMKDKPYGRRFDFSRVAPETLACLLLDALSTAHAIDWKVNGSFTFPEEYDPPQVVDDVTREFQALHDLMFKHVCVESERSQLSEKARPGTWKNKSIPGDAAVYVFWYSQLRQLLAQEPHLAKSLRIRALPGGGFKGDWHVKVELGSVSIRLGKTIRNHLVSAQEDYERFLVGLSFPVNEKITQSGLLAWPGAPTDAKFGVKHVNDIWEKAHQRSRIDKYPQFNRLLATIGGVLAGKYLDPRDTDAKVDADDLAKRLPGLMKGLREAATELQMRGGPSSILSAPPDDRRLTAATRRDRRRGSLKNT